MTDEEFARECFSRGLGATAKFLGDGLSQHYHPSAPLS